MPTAVIPILLSGPSVTVQDAEALANQMDMAMKLVASQLGDQTLEIGQIILETGDTNGG